MKTVLCTHDRCCGLYIGSGYCLEGILSTPHSWSAHRSTRVSEQAQRMTSEVNNLMWTKKVCGGPLQIEIYGAKLSEISLLPYLIFARWRTWINAGVFHSYRFDEVK
jgi:hypothetical protein